MDDRLIKFDVKGDKSGYLVPLEPMRNIPFEIKRVFYIYGADPTGKRGHHTQKTLKEVVVCVHGSCKIRLEDAKGEKTFELNKPDIGLYIGPMVWREMFDFSPDCVLLALVDQSYYDEKDYIRDYQEYLQALKQKIR